MNPLNFKIGILAVLMIAAASCGDKSKDDKKEQSALDRQEEPRPVIPVDTAMLGKKTFQKQIVCNGKLRAELNSALNFKTSGVINSIRVGNGSYVKKGQVLAVLDEKDAKKELEKAQRQMEKAYIDLQDELIGQGYMEDTLQVPSKVLQNAKVSSNYSSAEDALDQAKRKVEECKLMAPFSGRVANLSAKIYDQSGNSFCTLIDDATFDVEFKVLEAEFKEVFKDQQVKVVPYIDDSKSFVGTVNEINPLIDENGQIMVRARVRNSGGYLMEGMNVKILLEREVPDCFVVAKDAVITRNGYSVIFCYQNGKAVWKYVDIVMSNVDSHVITGSKEKKTMLDEQDRVITSNNINLDDGTPVSLNK